ncbi:MAG TPA: SRPBCC domain-containing protein [Prolixibacteraceae bacterium]|nr:SRPBCC domain-containing protein [Prolixibacteraceae bacterium]HPR62389.1 SRPBCC domain-containing protein [Prolixibacteraceae bacterium]
MKSLKKYYKLYASPADVYNALTNPVMLEIWTGEKAVFKAEPGFEFSLWDGEIVGRNVKFEMDKMIQQIWYFDNVESLVTFKLHPDKKFTSVELRHDNIPDEAFDNIADGWDSDFFGSLEELFND